jgi:tRNA (guanine-N7-)-methyltransferase
LLNDYLYLLKPGGKLYTITDVEDLHKWHLEVISSNPTMKRVPEEEIEKDEFIQFMKNTDEAKKVKKKNESMFVLVHEKVSNNNINSIEDLWNFLK